MIVCDFCQQTQYNVKYITRADNGAAICLECAVKCVKEMMPEKFEAKKEEVKTEA